MNPRSLKTLLWVKQRRLDELEQRVQAQMAQVAATEAALAQAEAARARCADDELACEDKIAALRASESFVPEQIVTLGFVLQGLADATRQAGDACTRAANDVQAAHAKLAELRQAQQRAEHQHDQLQQRREAQLRELDQQGEDTQDEESEEAAVARKVAAQRDGQREAAAA